MSEQFNASMMEHITGTPWTPVPGRNSMNIPTNIEEDGTRIYETGNVDGYAEEDENSE